MTNYKDENKLTFLDALVAKAKNHKVIASLIFGWMLFSSLAVTIDAFRSVASLFESENPTDEQLADAFLLGKTTGAIGFLLLLSDPAAGVDVDDDLFQNYSRLAAFMQRKLGLEVRKVQANYDENSHGFEDFLVRGDLERLSPRLATHYSYGSIIGYIDLSLAVLVEQIPESNQAAIRKYLGQILRGLENMVENEEHVQLRSSQRERLLRISGTLARIKEDYAHSIPERHALISQLNLLHDVFDEISADLSNYND